MAFGLLAYFFILESPECLHTPRVSDCSPFMGIMKKNHVFQYFSSSTPRPRKDKSICVKKCLDRGGYIIFLGTISCPLILKMETGPCVNTLYMKQDYAII